MEKIVMRTKIGISDIYLSNYLFISVFYGFATLIAKINGITGAFAYVISTTFIAWLLTQKEIKKSIECNKKL